MKQAGRLFLIGLQFLTRIPVPIDLKATGEDYGRCMALFPIYGLIIGGLMYLVYWLLGLLGFAILPALGAIAFQCWVTGCFHIDGLSDTCDGLFSSRSRERILEIMKDSRIGVMGGVAIVLDLGLKVVLLWEAARVSTTMVVPLLGMMAFGKISAVGAACFGKSVGIGLREAVDKVGPLIWIVAFVLGGGALGVLLGWKSLWLLPVAVLFPLLAVWFFRRKLGGLTGDTLGAISEVGEILFLTIYFILMVPR